MSDETKPKSTDGQVTPGREVVVEGDGGIQAEGLVAAHTDYALVVAQFAGPGAALETYQALGDAETAGHVTIEGVLVVRAGANGRIDIQKVTDHSTRDGLKWGIVGGVVLGVLFPPSIIGSAAALGVTGGVLGKLRQMHRRSELEASLTGVLAPNASGILVLARLPAVSVVRQTMAKATKVTEVPVDGSTADAITQAAKAATF